MKAKIRRLTDFHPTGKPRRPSVCYMMGKYCLEVKDNNDKLQVPGIFIRNAVIMFPAGIETIPDSNFSWAAVQGLFTGEYQYRGWHFNKSSWCIECLPKHSFRIKAEAKRLCRELRAPVVVKIVSSDKSELYIAEPIMPNIEQELTYLNLEDKRRALQALYEMDRNIRAIVSTTPDDIVQDASGKRFLFYEAYKRLLEIWPAAQFTKNEEYKVVQKFLPIKPSTLIEFSDCPEISHAFTLFNNRWCFMPSEGSKQLLDAGFCELGYSNWKQITAGRGISPKAITFMDYMSSYFDSYRRLSKVGRLLEEEQKSRARRRTLSAIFQKAWADKEQIMSNPSLYTAEIPDCASGTSFSGKLYLPLGALVECWQNCPAFRLDNGRFVIRFASGLSGYTKGEAINLSTGRIYDYDSDVFRKSTRAALIEESAPYRTKAKGMLQSGVVPVRSEELMSSLKGANQTTAD